MKNLHSQSVSRFFQALGTLKTEEEYYAFFEDVCTVVELRDIAQRLDTAFMLDEGASYQTIAKSIGVSTATIGRVSKCLNYGGGGYRMVIDRLRREEADSEIAK